VGYAIGRIGCLLSGDGDYGIPTNLPWGMSFPNGVVPTTERVHPTPLYEFFVWMLIAYLLWRIGARMLQRKESAGLVFCAYLVLTGMARFVVEIIRLNPRSFLGMSNAQAASVASALLGILLYFFFVRRNSVARRSVSSSERGRLLLLLVNHAFLHRKCPHIRAAGCPLTGRHPAIKSADFPGRIEPNSSSSNQLTALIVADWIACIGVMLKLHHEYELVCRDHDKPRIRAAALRSNGFGEIPPLDFPDFGRAPKNPLGCCWFCPLPECTHRRRYPCQVGAVLFRERDAFIINQRCVFNRNNSRADRILDSPLGVRVRSHVIQGVCLTDGRLQFFRVNSCAFGCCMGEHCAR
jgi:hypothetical protein